MQENEYKYENLIADGFTEKFEKYYENYATNDINNKLYNEEYGEWALSKVLLPSSANAYKINDNNYKKYLSDYDYYKMGKLISWTRIWIDDKMTLKYRVC